MAALHEAGRSGTLKQFHSCKNQTVIRHGTIGRPIFIGTTDLSPSRIPRMKSDRLKAKRKQQIEVKDAQRVEGHFLAQLARNIQPHESEHSVIRIKCFVVGELGHDWTTLWCHLMKHCSASQ